MNVSWKPSFLVYFLIFIFPFQIAMAETQSVTRIPGAAGYGLRMKNVGDHNGDGYEDVIVTGFGQVDVLSGRDGAVLMSYKREPLERGMGDAIAKVGDIDRDGIPDYVVGIDNQNVHAARQIGLVRAISGRDASEIYVVMKRSEGDGFAQEINSVGDLNGDGISEYTVSSNLDYVELLNGMDGSVLQRFTPPVAGQSISIPSQPGPLGDVDGDRVPDFSLRFRDYGIESWIEVRSGSNYSTLLTISSSSLSDIPISKEGYFGGHFAAAYVDFDDQIDFITQYEVSVRGSVDYLRGEVLGYSGANGALIFRARGSQAQEYYGRHSFLPYDIDRDGDHELLVGAQGWSLNENSPGREEQGYFEILSLPDGESVAQTRGSVREGRFGTSLAIVRDPNRVPFHVVVGASREDAVYLLPVPNLED